MSVTVFVFCSTKLKIPCLQRARKDIQECVERLPSPSILKPGR